MSLPVNSVGGNPQIPGISAETFIPDQLIAGRHPLVTDSVTVLAGQVFPRGSVLGRITASGKYVVALAAAADGSQNPAVVAVDNVDATGADVNAGVYLAGEFNGAAMTLGTGITIAAAAAALRPLSIYVKGSVSAADPT